METEEYRATGRQDYRRSHSDVHAASAYKELYESGYFAAQWERLEKGILGNVFAQLKSCGSKRLLDLACGQGRVSIFAAQYFEEVLGIDYSKQMLAFAESALEGEPLWTRERVRFQVGDVREFSASAPLDVVTAFRFFLNAEEELRREGLRCAHRNLRVGGTLVANVHVSRSSPLATFYALSKFARRMRNLPPDPVRNSISLTAFSQLLRSERFKVDRVYRYSILPRIGTLTDAIADRHMQRLDRWARCLPGMTLLCQSFIVTAHKV